MNLIKIKSLVINLDNVAYWQAIPTSKSNKPIPKSAPPSDPNDPKVLYEDADDVTVIIHFVGEAAWERVASNVITAIVTLAAPSGLLYILHKKLTPLIRRRLGRISELEQSIDPKRTSSESGCDPEVEESPPTITGETTP